MAMKQRSPKTKMVWWLEWVFASVVAGLILWPIVGAHAAYWYEAGMVFGSGWTLYRSDEWQSR